MFYTKYRPQKFSQLSQPNDVAVALVNQIKAQKTVHAYLFIGPRGTGKTTTARLLAKALNCEKLDKNGDPCDKCPLCKSIKAGSFVDLIEIDAASNRGIDDIRELRERVKLAPSVGARKVYIVDEVHMLTAEAFNALLKTLEEPPQRVTFILCTTEVHKVPETIKSRCQVFRFKRPGVAQIVQRLGQICKAEGVAVHDDALRKIAEASFGGFRDAETLLQQVVEGGVSVDSFAGMANKQSYIDFVSMVLSCETQDAIRFVNTLYNDGIDLYVWTLGLVMYLRDLLFISTDAYKDLLDVTDAVFSGMEEQANKLTPKEVVALIELFVKAQNDIKSTSVPQLPLEIAVINACPDSIEHKVESKSPQIQQPSKNYASNTSLSEIESKWSDVIKTSFVHNNSIHALLSSCKPVALKGSKLLLEVSYKFHKERMEITKNMKIVEDVLTEVFGSTITYSCVVGEPKKKPAMDLTDYNVAVPAGKDDILEVFDGALPL